MDEGNDFMELLELQDNLEMVTKTELLDRARTHGASISDRQLTSFASEGLLPKSARIGSRGGAFPKLAVEQLLFVSRFAKAWGCRFRRSRSCYPYGGTCSVRSRAKEVSLTEFEYVARASITLQEAWFAVPSVLQQELRIQYAIPGRWLNQVQAEGRGASDGSVATTLSRSGSLWRPGVTRPATSSWSTPSGSRFPGGTRVTTLPASVSGFPTGSISPCGTTQHREGVSFAGGSASDPDGTEEGA